MLPETTVQSEEEALAEYIDGVGAAAEAPTDEDRKRYWTSCYDTVRKTYKQLLLYREDIDGMPKNRQAEARAQVVEQFRINRSARVRSVTELRRLGVVVDDPVVPLSKI